MTDVAEVHWQAEGGVVLESNDGRARMFFFGDAPKKTLRVTGKYKSGVAFSETWTMEVGQITE